jgi:hypothetical protein
MYNKSPCNTELGDLYVYNTRYEEGELRNANHPTYKQRLTTNYQHFST